MVLHFVYDAGGSFQKVYTYLFQKQDLSDNVVWLPDDCIQFRNSHDPSRWVYVSHCSTHNTKNARNQFKESKSNGSKCYLDTEGNLITWDCLVTIYNEDQLQQLHQHAARSDHITPRPTDDPLPISTRPPQANK